jgi:hypothetical protein
LGGLGTAFNIEGGTRTTSIMNSDDDVSTFEGWLNYQAIDPSAITEEELAAWRHEFDEMTQRLASQPLVGRMTLRQVPGEYRYAVAVRDEVGLLLTLWVRRSPTGEVFIFQPRSDRSWNPHTSYHLDGTLHLKSHDQKMLKPSKRQALTAQFKGAEHLGMYFGHGPRRVGAVCDPTDFSGIMEVPSGLLGAKEGGVAVDLVQPGYLPVDISPVQVVQQEIFREVAPWIAIRVVKQVSWSEGMGT